MSLFEDIVSELDNGGFVATVEWMSQKYDEMNTKLFEGKLGKCHFEITTTGKGSKGRRFGYFYMNTRNLKVSASTRRMYLFDFLNGEKMFINKNNFFEYCKPTIGLNGEANVSRTEKSALTTLVHEMCHYYTYMNGYAPKQGHGPEFKNVASYVNSKANGIIFSVQTYASAEQAAESEWSDEIKSAQAKRQNNKLAKRTVVVVFKENGQVRLINTNSQSLIRNILAIEENCKGTKKCKKMVMSTDMDLKTKLNSLGFNKDMTAYRFWDLDRWPEAKKLVQEFDGWDTLYAGEINDNDEINPDSFEPVDITPQEPKIKRFYFKTTDGKEFEAKNVTADELKQMLKQRFPNWSDQALERIMANQNYIMKEDVGEVKENVEEGNNNDISITPDMNLSIVDLG